MSASWDDRLAEPCEYEEPTDNLPLWLHGVIIGALLLFVCAVLWVLAAFEPLR